MIRGIRGATTADNTVDSITANTIELINKIMYENKIKEEEIAAVLFTMTKDLNAVYPAKAVREFGFKYVPLVCYQELDIENSLEKCIRVLFLVNTEMHQDEIKHIYLHNAVNLRPDLKNNSENG